MSPSESAARGDSNGLAGTHEGAITSTSSGRPSQASSSQCTPSAPSAFASSCGSQTMRGRPARDQHARELADRQLARLDVHVRVDEARRRA